MAVRVLCAGDIHIGRQTSKTQVPYRTADAWLAIVDLAIERKVDLVALSGDVVDKELNRFEAHSPLHTGMQRLRNASIPVVATAGNHDWYILPDFAAQVGFEHLQFLGRNGMWEQRTISRGETAILQVVGWSFPAEHHTHDPFSTSPAIVRGDLPVLGMVHTELGVSTSKYAPTKESILSAHDVDLWLIGHIHLFKEYTESRILNPGSPYAMDPGEAGAHGVWIATINAHAKPELEKVAISPVEYARVQIDVGGVVDAGEFQSRSVEALETKATSVSATELSVRLRYTGESKSWREIGQWAELFHQETTELMFAGTMVTVDEVVSEVRQPVDLQELARELSPAGETARFLLALEQPKLPSEYKALWESTVEQIAARKYETVSQGQTEVEMSDSDVRDHLRSSSWNLLSALVGSKEENLR